MHAYEYLKELNQSHSIQRGTSIISPVSVMFLLVLQKLQPEIPFYKRCITWRNI